MRQAPKCVEPGCNKFRVRHQRCSKHAGEYLARIAAEGGGMSETPAELHKETPIGEKPLETKVPADFTERLEGIEFVKMDDSAVEAGDQAQEAPAMRSLLYFLQVPPTPPRRPGVFVDFTGNEELLAQVEALTDDLSHDVISLLRGLLNGELCKRKDEPVGLCE